MIRTASMGWSAGIGTTPLLIGAAIGIGGSIAPFALFAEMQVTVLDCVASSLTLAAVAAAIVVPVLVAIDVAGADAGTLIRDCFLARRGTAARARLFGTALRTWTTIVLVSVLAAFLVAVASALVNSGVIGELGSPTAIALPLAALLGTSTYAAIIGLALSLVVGNPWVAVAVHATMLLMVPTLPALTDDGMGHRAAVVLPFAPLWSHFGERSVGPMALSMSAPAAAFCVLGWLTVCGCIVLFSLRRIDGLSIATWAKGG